MYRGNFRIANTLLSRPDWQVMACENQSVICNTELLIGVKHLHGFPSLLRLRQMQLHHHICVNQAAHCDKYNKNSGRSDVRPELIFYTGVSPHKTAAKIVPSPLHDSLVGVTMKPF